MFYACQQYGIETGLDEKILNEVNDYFKPIKQKYIDNGQINPKSLGTGCTGSGIQGTGRHAVQHDRKPHRYEGNGQV